MSFTPTVCADIATTTTVFVEGSDTNCNTYFKYVFLQDLRNYDHHQKTDKKRLLVRKKEGLRKKVSQAFNYNHMIRLSKKTGVFKETIVITPTNGSFSEFPLIPCDKLGVSRITLISVCSVDFSFLYLQFFVVSNFPPP